jgi:hypothetical protein
LEEALTGMSPFICGGWYCGKNWYDKAVTLKNASDKILDAYIEACQHLATRFDSASDGVPVEITRLDLVDLDQYPVYVLLMGYSIENLFRGIIICRMWLDNPSSVEVEDFTKLRVPIKGSTKTMPLMKHGFRRLLAAKAVNIEFSNDEKDMMDNLDEAIIWAGRYATPKEYNGNVIIGPQIIRLRPYNNRFIDTIDAIYFKSSEELARLCSLQSERVSETYGLK